MNKKIRQKLSFLLLLVLILSTSLTAYAVNDNSDVSANSQQVPVRELIVDSQISPKFPEEEPTDRIYAQDRKIFKGYEDQGQIIVESHGATSASVYVNGNLISISDALKNKSGKVAIDISKYTVNGDNTLKVLDVSPDDAYINIFVPYPELTVGTPKDVGFSEKKLDQIDKLINEEVKKGFPGAVLLIMKDGKIIKNTAYGYKLKYDGEELLNKFEPMETDTMFDLASNTKMFATNLTCCAT
jgi:hypothetical protein